MFTITVGASNSRLSAHADVLSKSPVLARMCEGPFQESVTSHINLPEDCFQDIACLLEYLYTGNLMISIPRYGGDGTAFASKMADIYIMADKYQVPSLKNMVVDQLMTEYRLSADSAHWFQIAHRIYQNTSGSRSDEKFRNYFTDRAGRVIRQLNDDILKTLDDLLEDGGKFAVDVVKAHRQNHTRETLEKLSIQQKLTDTETKLTGANTGIGAMRKDLAIATEREKAAASSNKGMRAQLLHQQDKALKLEYQHGVNHRSCTACKSSDPVSPYNEPTRKERRTKLTYAISKFHRE